MRIERTSSCAVAAPFAASNPSAAKSTANARAVPPMPAASRLRREVDPCTRDPARSARRGPRRDRRFRRSRGERAGQRRARARRRARATRPGKRRACRSDRENLRPAIHPGFGGEKNQSGTSLISKADKVQPACRSDFSLCRGGRAPRGRRARASSCLRPARPRGGRRVQARAFAQAALRRRGWPLRREGAARALLTSARERGGR